MGSWRMVVMLSICGAVLWALTLWVSLEQPKSAVDVAHRLVELREADITSISIERAGETLEARFVRRGQETIASSKGRRLLAVATSRFFAALENTYTRRLLIGQSETEQRRLGTKPGHASLTIVSNLEKQVFRLGTTGADGELTWISRERNGQIDLALVSTTEANSLFLSPPAWIEPRVFAELGDIVSIETQSGDSRATFAGVPLAWVNGFSSIRLDSEKLQEAIGGLKELVVVEQRPERQNPDGTNPTIEPADVFELKLKTAEVEVRVRIGGPGCAPFSKAVIVNNPTGVAATRDVCVDGEAIRQWREIAKQPEELVLAGVLRTDVVVERFVLTRVKDRIAQEPVKVEAKGDSDEAAGEFLADVASASEGTPARRVEVESNGPLVVRGRLDLEFRGGDSDRVMIAESSGRFFVSLAGQPLVWPLDGQRAERILAADQTAFRFRGLIRRDPTELRSITLSKGGAKSWSFKIGRGWQPPLAAGTAASIANLSAVRFEPKVTRAQAGLTKPKTEFSVVFARAPIVSEAPNALRISIGRKVSDGCYVQILANGSLAPIAPISIIDEKTCRLWLALR